MITVCLSLKNCLSRTSRPSGHRTRLEKDAVCFPPIAKIDRVAGDPPECDITCYDWTKFGYESYACPTTDSCRCVPDDLLAKDGFYENEILGVKSSQVGSIDGITPNSSDGNKANSEIPLLANKAFVDTLPQVMNHSLSPPGLPINEETRGMMNI